MKPFLCLESLDQLRRIVLVRMQGSALLRYKNAVARLNPNLVLKLVTDHSCEGKFGVLGAFTLDSPIAILAHDAHFASRSSPMIDFPGEREPHSSSAPQFAQESQQISVNAPRLLLNNVIRMDNKTDQPVSRDNRVYLRLPQLQ
jgi:hypothetical protein